MKIDILKQLHKKLSKQPKPRQITTVCPKIYYKCLLADEKFKNLKLIRYFPTRLKKFYFYFY